MIFACGAQNASPCLLIIAVLSLDVFCLIGGAGIAEETLLLASVRAWSGPEASQRNENQLLESQECDWARLPSLPRPSPTEVAGFTAPSTSSQSTDGRGETGCPDCCCPAP